VVLIIRNRRHIDVAELVDQLRHRITVSDDQHASTLVLVHDSRSETLGVGGGNYDDLLNQPLCERSRGLLGRPGITDINGISDTHSLAAAKHPSETFRAPFALGGQRWVLNGAQILLGVP